MSRLKVITFGNPTLRQTAKPVTVFHKKLHSLIDSIAKTLHNCDNGAALAANQIGVLKKISVVDYQGEYLELINPEIIYSEGEQIEEEGCLSFPGYTGLVKRYKLVRVKYLDRNGNENIIERTGKLAKCFQHELDHLNGILFIDRMLEDFLTSTDSDKRISLQSVIDIANGKSTNK